MNSLSKEIKEGDENEFVAGWDFFDHFIKERFNFIFKFSQMEVDEIVASSSKVQGIIFNYFNIVVDIEVLLETSYRQDFGTVSGNVQEELAFIVLYKIHEHFLNDGDAFCHIEHLRIIYQLFIEFFKLRERLFFSHFVLILFFLFFSFLLFVVFERKNLSFHLLEFHLIQFPILNHTDSFLMFIQREYVQT